MTDFCGGGLSQQKPGGPTTLQVGTNLIQSLLTTFVPGGAAVAALIEVYEIFIPAICAVDPPAMPVWDAKDIAGFAAGMATGEDWFGTRAKIVDLVNNWIWHQYCECADVATPPMPPVPSLPRDAGYLNPGGSKPCYTAGWAGDIPVLAQGATGGWLDVGLKILPLLDATPIVLTDNAGNTWNTYNCYQNLKQHNWIVRRPIGGPDPANLFPVFEFIPWQANNQQGATWSVYSNNVPEPTSGTHVLSTSPARLSAYAYVTDPAGIDWTVTDPLATINNDWYCGASPGSPNNCCPPDPALLLGIQNILQFVLEINGRLGGTEGTYVDGVRHADLNGTGSVLIGDKTTAIRIETHPPYPSVIVVPGTPSYYYDMGFVTPYILGSPLRGSRITYVSQTVQLPRHTDQVGYTLLNGITVDLVELVPA